MLAFEHDELPTESEVFEQRAAAGAKTTKQGAQKKRNGVEPVEHVEHGRVLSQLDNQSSAVDFYGRQSLGEGHGFFSYV